MFFILLDENFNNRVIDELRKRVQDLVMLRVQDHPELYQKDDPTILQWAADNGYLVFTHDKDTMIDFAYDRVRDGLPMRGLVLVPGEMPVGQIIDNMEIVLGGSTPDEYDGIVTYFPL